MIAPLLILIVPILLIVLLIVEHVAVYLWDAKGLRKYPGLNCLCGLTNLAYIFEIWKGDGFRTRALMKAHHQNKIIRLGPNALSFADVQAIKDIYGHNTACTKGDMYSVTAGPHRSILNSVDKQEHSEKRRRLAAAFATKHLVEWEHKVVDKCERLISQLDQYCNPIKAAAGANEIDFRRMTNLFTIEAIADIALSEHLGLIEADNDLVTVMDQKDTVRTINYLPCVRAIGRTSSTFVWSTNGYPYLKKIYALISRSYGDEVRYNSSFNDIVRSLVSRRLQRQNSGAKLDDLVSSLTKDKLGKHTGLSEEEIIAEVNVFMDAGSDTTAIQLTHVMYYLLKHPDKLQKLREELDKHLDDDSIIPSYASVRDIAYLRACLDESLRLSPPVSFGLQRKTPPEGAFISGQWIAGNTSVSLPAYVAHRDPVIFPDPENFVPERWLKEEAKELQRYFIAFSTGARGCIGRNISYIEQHVLIAALVRRYEFALPSSEWEITREERFNLWPRNLPLKIWHRLGTTQP